MVTEEEKDQIKKCMLFSTVLDGWVGLAEANISLGSVDASKKSLGSIGNLLDRIRDECGLLLPKTRVALEVAIQETEGAFEGNGGKNVLIRNAIKDISFSLEEDLSIGEEDE